jgi:hypothetical protein
MKLLPLLFVCLTSFAYAQNPVIVELFTSQGCSSCPAADKNLAEIIENAERNGQEVLGLSFHVDYWNYIGWKDPYSKKEFTERQKKYASVMSSESIYTPQVIVNGKTEFVGSDKNKIVDEVAKALKQKMLYQISVNQIKKAEENILITYSINKAPENQTVCVALIEKNVSNDVTRGENSGRKLSHRNVVRSFLTSVAQKNGTLELSIPTLSKIDQMIIFLQNNDWMVTAAERKDIQ